MVYRRQLYRDLPAWASSIIVAAGNVLGLIVYLVVQYTHLATQGVLLVPTSGLTSMVLYSFILPLILTPFYSKWCQDKTGNIWLGATFNALLFTSTVVSATHLYVSLTMFGV